MMQRRQSASAVLVCVKEKLASPGQAGTADLLDWVVATIAEGRGYQWLGIYLAIDGASICQSSSGQAPSVRSAKDAHPGATTPGMELNDVRSEVVAPIRLGVRTLGLIVADTGRAGTSQERALLQQVAKLVAKHLTTAPGKLLLRHAREQARAQAAQKHKPPQSERPAARKAAAGEQIPR